MLDVGEPHRTEQRKHLRGDLSELAEVRSWVAGLLTCADRHRLDDILLVVDELVSNALTHAAGPYWIRLCWTADTARIEVRDDSPLLARQREPDMTGGRGMHIVTACATRWDQQRIDGGKVVWAELPTTQA
ncbi:ATP-binding protein [Pseudonocardiaceae bacterium YIM PH 21723]|nr:ATP-binding protein [Pseudonocardiaceae bacterium YIM PH 21723]